MSVFPFASSAVIVIVCVAPEIWTAAPVMARRVAVAGANVTAVVAARALPRKVPDTVAVPDDVDEVKVAVYVPSLLSVTVDSVPRVADRPTVPPDAVTLAPSACLSWTAMVVVDVPFAVIVASEVEIVV